MNLIEEARLKNQELLRAKLAVEDGCSTALDRRFRMLEEVIGLVEARYEAQIATLEARLAALEARLVALETKKEPK